MGCIARTCSSFSALTKLTSHLPGPVSPPSSDENKDKLLLLRRAFNSVRLEELKTTASCLNPKYWTTSHMPGPGPVADPRGLLSSPGLGLA